jgi:hypothetical protein
MKTVTVKGRLATAPKMSENVGNNTPRVARFKIYTPEEYQEVPKSTFSGEQPTPYYITMRGELAKFCQEHLGRGYLVSITGIQDNNNIDGTAMTILSADERGINRS